MEFSVILTKLSATKNQWQFVIDLFLYLRNYVICKNQIVIYYGLKVLLH